jgi:hypothetical protein
MHTSIQTKWNLGGFVHRALESLATQCSVNLWGQVNPEVERAANEARLRMCALAYAFFQFGKAAELAKLASDERSHQFAGRLLQLALQAWPVQRRRLGMKAEVTPESQVAWQGLLEDLKTYFVGGPEALAAERHAIRTICEAVLSGAAAEPPSPKGTPNEPPDPASTQMREGQAEAADNLPTTSAPGSPSERRQSPAGLTEQESSIPAKSPGAVRGHINARMLEAIQTYQEAMGWNSRQWAEYLKCAKSSIVETQTWKDLSMRRAREQAERARDRRGRSQPRNRRG